MRPAPRAGRRIIWSSELSSSKESPGLICKKSRTGLGRTTRPALSIVRVVFITAFYHGIYHLQCHFVLRASSYLLSTLRFIHPKCSACTILAIDTPPPIFNNCFNIPFQTGGGHYGGRRRTSVGK